MAERIGFIGAGKLATGLSMALCAHGYEVSAFASRSAGSAQRLASLLPGAEAVAGLAEVAVACDMVFITTPDRAIEEVARTVRWRAGQGVVHCSGSLSLEPLASACADGASVASFHPLQTLSCIETPQEAAERLSAICYAVEGEGRLAERLERMAQDLGGQVIRVAPEDRALYHQAAVFACGYITALLDATEEMWVQYGLLATAGTGLPWGPVGSNDHRPTTAARAQKPVPRARSHAAMLKPFNSRWRPYTRGCRDLGPLAALLGLRSLSFASPEYRQPLADVLQPFVHESVSAVPRSEVTSTPDHSVR